MLSLEFEGIVLYQQQRPSAPDKQNIYTDTLTCTVRSLADNRYGLHRGQRSILHQKVSTPTPTLEVGDALSRVTSLCMVSCAWYKAVAIYVSDQTPF
jgi:hypothetical protein